MSVVSHFSLAFAGAGGSGQKITFNQVTIVAPWSIAFWIKPNTPTADYGVVVANAGGTEGIFLRGSGGAQNLKIDAFVVADKLSASALTDAVWTHVAITHAADGTTKIYLAGSLDNTLAATGTTLIVGQFGDDNNSEILKASLDDMRFYSEVVSGVNVAALAAGTDYTTNLANYWAIEDGGSGTNVADSIGGANGTIADVTNITWSPSVPTTLTSSVKDNGGAAAYFDDYCG